LLRLASASIKHREFQDVLRVEHLQAALLPPLSFEVATGECLAVEGPSGAGKTRLLRAIADLDPAPGQVFLGGAERNEMPAPVWRRSVRYCAAEPAWWSDTPRDAFAPAPAARVERLLHALGLNLAVLDRSVAALSTGERQRLALARALLDEPQVLLLDEPTAALDPQAAALAEELIRYQTLAGRCVILVSHDHGQIERLAHARLLLSKETARPLAVSAP
jgi:ABC-type iron transport system FetAB ATPase subunit